MDTGQKIQEGLEQVSNKNFYFWTSWNTYSIFDNGKSWKI